MPFFVVVGLSRGAGMAQRWLLGLAAVLLGCPQLLDDRFETLGAAGSGGDGCVGQSCGGSAGSGGNTSVAGSGGVGGAAGSGGSVAGTGGSSAGVGGSSGSSGSSGSAGNGVSAGAAGTGAEADGPDASTPIPNEDPACWTLELSDTSSGYNENCLGIDGWNQIENDTSTSSAVELSYQNGDICFQGPIDNDGWGAVYNMQLNDGAAWDATAYGVAGFVVTTSGSGFPPSLALQFKNGSDEYCRHVVLGGALEVPFTDAHPDCSTSSSSVPDASDLTELQLIFPVAASAYSVDFCVQLRAYSGD